MLASILDFAGLAILAIISLASYRYRTTDEKGTITAFLMGAIVGLTAGWLWVVYMILFFAFVYWLFKEPAIAVLFVASIASSLSDTLATEIGLLSKGKPHEIINPSREVEPGRSGGITHLGIAAEVLGSVFFALLAFAM